MMYAVSATCRRSVVDGSTNQRRPGSCSGSPATLEPFLHARRRLKGHRLARLNLQRGAGARVAAGACGALAYAKRAEAGHAEAAVFLDRLAELAEQRIHQVVDG